MANSDLVQRLIDLMSWKEHYLETQRAALADTGDPAIDALREDMIEDLEEEWETVASRIAQVFIQQFSDDEISELIALNQAPVARKMNSAVVRLSLIQAMSPYAEEKPTRFN